MHEDRKQRLADFVAWVEKHIKGDEKGESQIYLDHLFAAFGRKGVKEAGAVLEQRVKKADNGGTAFADLVWKPVVLIEMKRRGEDLSRHYRQAFDYWTRLVPGRPRYAVLCNFDEFWVYDFETQMDTPVDKLALADLPQRYGPLAFLFPTDEKPVFGNDQESVTRAAADRLAVCFNKLIAKGGPSRGAAVHPPDAGGPVRRGYRAARALHGHSPAGGVQGASRQFRSARRAFLGNEHAGWDPGRAI